MTMMTMVAGSVRDSEGREHVVLDPVAVCLASPQRVLLLVRRSACSCNDR